MPRDPVMVCNAVFAWLSCASAVCNCWCRVATSWMSCAIAPTSMTAHCARAGGYRRHGQRTCEQNPSDTHGSISR